MAFENLVYLPVSIVILLVGTLAITFSLAWTSKHVTYFPPYISDTGTHPPESCIFGQMLNIIAILTSILIYIRYRQLRIILRNYYSSNNLEMVNKVALYSGLMATFGMSLVGNFQENDVIIVHFTGAFLVFGFGAVYQCLQGFISFKIYPRFGKSKIIGARIILSVISFVTFVIFFGCAMVSLSNFEGEDLTKWNKLTDAYYEVHLISAVAEWICAISISLFIFCFVFDFNRVVVSEPIVILQDQFAMGLHLRNIGN